MKHLRLSMSTLLEVVAVLALLALLIMPARADWPTTKSLALPGGGTNVVSSQYSAGIGQAVYTSFKPSAIEVSFTGTPNTNATLSVSTSVGGPAYHTISITSNASTYVSFVTNDWWVFRDAYFYLSLPSVTNPAAITIQGQEK